MLKLMQPDTPPAPPPAPMPNGGHNPYEFIMNANNKPKRSLGGGSLKQRLIIVGGGFAVLLIIVLVLISTLSGSKGGNIDTLVKLAQRQNEIARVAGLGKDKAKSADVKDLAITVQLSVESDQAKTLAYLKKNGHKLKTKDLALLQSSATDQQLSAADSAGTFDSTFSQVIQDELTSYSNSLKSAYKEATGRNEKQVLKDNFNNVSYLLGTPKSS